MINAFYSEKADDKNAGEEKKKDSIVFINIYIIIFKEHDSCYSQVILQDRGNPPFRL